MQGFANELEPGIQCNACGSYRRGQATCGDVDILIGPPPSKEYTNIMTALLTRLRQSGFLTADLSLPNEADEPSRVVRRKRSIADDDDVDDSSESEDIVIGKKSYMGVCKLPVSGSKYRRIDIKSYPRILYPLALLYFTGPDHFNRYSFHQRLI